MIKHKGKISNIYSPGDVFDIIDLELLSTNSIFYERDVATATCVLVRSEAYTYRLICLDSMCRYTDHTVKIKQHINFITQEQLDKLVGDKGRFEVEYLGTFNTIYERKAEVETKTSCNLY